MMHGRTRCLSRSKHPTKPRTLIQHVPPPPATSLLQMQDLGARSDPNEVTFLFSHKRQHDAYRLLWRH